MVLYKIKNPALFRSNIVNHIHKILESHGGVYITPDIEANDNPFETPRLKEDLKITSQITGTDVEGNRFETLKQAQELFENEGFRVKRYKYGQLLKIGSLSSIKLFQCIL